MASKLLCLNAKIIFWKHENVILALKTMFLELEIQLLTSFHGLKIIVFECQNHILEA